MTTEGSIVLSTRLFVRELDAGVCVVFPVADPKLASYGELADALAEQEVFLAEYLRRARPEIAARFALPAGTHLRTVRVKIPREDLPRRMTSELDIDFACVILPMNDGSAWVSVPNVEHVLFVGKSEKLDEAIQAEVRRIVLVRDPQPSELTRLFPPAEQRITAVEIQVGRRSREAGVSVRAAAREERRSHAIDTLAGAGRFLQTELASSRAASDPTLLVGRERETELLDGLLAGSVGRERLSALLVGPERAGKSALFRAWVAREVLQGRAPYVLRTSGAQLIAGMGGFGQWQERIQRVMEAAASLDAIVYFDDLADLLAEHADGGADLASAIKPHLERGLVRVVGELRSDDADRLELVHYGFLSSFTRVKVDGLDAKTTQEALARRAAHDARHEPDRPTMDAEAQRAIVDLAERYLPYGAFPGKGIELYEDLRAVREASGTSDHHPIGADAVYGLFSLKTGVPGFLLRASTPLDPKDVAAELKRAVIGQDAAADRLASTIGVVKAGVASTQKPLATFLFVGPTGVGKTELARALARYLFGSPERMVRFDMSEFMSPDAAERLIRGTDREAGLLTRRVREQPFCLLLLDEIEKAHPAVFDLLLQVTGEGRLTDARGKTTFFHNAIVVMTSNIGAASRRGSAGFTPSADATDEAYYQKHVEATFRPELINRLDRVVAFRALSREEVRQVANLALERLRTRRGFTDLGLSIQVAEDALDHLAAGGYSATLGARALRRHLEEHLVAPIARQLAKLGETAREGLVRVTLAAPSAKETREKVDETSLDRTISASSVLHEGLRIEVRRKRSASVAREQHGVEQVSFLRRRLDRLLSRPTVVAVKDRLDQLVTDLAHADLGKKNARKEHDIGELLGDHHRLSELYGKLARAQGDAYSAEELAFTALFDGLSIAPFLAEMEAASRTFMLALPFVLTALASGRDEVALVVEELDPGAFALWFVPMLHELTARRYQVTCHIEGGERLANDEWGGDHQGWGPPRTIAQTLDAIERASHGGRGVRNVLLLVRGPHAGAFLALEAGLHRLQLAKGSAAPTKPGGAKEKEDDGRYHAYVHFIANRAAIASAEEWMHESLKPPGVEAVKTRKAGGAQRLLDGILGTLTIGGHKPIPMQLEAYWSRQIEVALEVLLGREDAS